MGCIGVLLLITRSTSVAWKYQNWIGLSSVLRPHQHSIGCMGDGFYRSKDPTNSIKVLKEHEKCQKWLARPCLSLSNELPEIIKQTVFTVRVECRWVNVLCNEVKVATRRTWAGAACCGVDRWWWHKLLSTGILPDVSVHVFISLIIIVVIVRLVNEAKHYFLFSQSLETWHASLFGAHSIPDIAWTLNRYDYFTLCGLEERTDMSINILYEDGAERPQLPQTVMDWSSRPTQNWPL